MALSKEDLARLGYKAKIEWYKQRSYDISDGTITLDDYLKEKSNDFEAVNHSADELVSVMADLVSKAEKLEGKIEHLSAALYIKLNKEKTPDLCSSVAKLDPDSKGEYISYKFYDSLLREMERVDNSISLDAVVDSSTGDSFSDSMAMQNLRYSAYNATSAFLPPGGKQSKYGSTWLNNSFSWDEFDHAANQILGFVEGYINDIVDPDYIPWSMRKDVGETRTDAGNLWDMWKRYSPTNAGTVPAVVTGIEYIGALKPDPTIHDLTTRYATYANDFLNRTNQVFDIRLASSLICCFMQWGVRLDTKTLKGIRALLNLLQQDLRSDFISLINGIQDLLNNLFRGLLCNQLVSLINSIIQRLVDPIQQWLLNPQDATWSKIFKCTAIDEMINVYLAQAITAVKDKLYKLILSWYKKIELQHIKNNVKLEVKTNQKWIGEFVRLLDTIIEATELAAQCGLGNTPMSEAVQQIPLNYKLGENADYVFPVDPNPTIYNSFIPTNPEAKPQGGSSEPGTVNFDTGAVGSQATSNAPFVTMSDCLKKMPKDGITGVQDWLVSVQTTSQGSNK